MRVPGWLYHPLMWLTQPRRAVSICGTLLTASGCLALWKGYLLTGRAWYIFAAGMLACVWVAVVVSWRTTRRRVSGDTPATPRRRITS